MSSPNARKTCSLTDDGGRLSGPSVQAAVREAARQLRQAGIDEPRLTAELLLAHAGGCARIDLYRRPDDPLAPDVQERFRSFLARRLAREPIQHILGRTEFWSRPILCDRRALIPRPETELVVEVALQILRERAPLSVGAPRPIARDTLLLADIGAGTGCIAVALAAELPNARLYASDISREALDLAAENLRLNGVERRVRLLEGDLTEPFRTVGLIGQFDLVVSNPPYIPDAEIPALQPEVREHDPARALAGGPDGLRLIERLLTDVPALLRLDGHFVFEIGAGEAEAVQDMIRRTGAWRAVRVHRDGAGIERVLAIQKEIQPCHGAWK